jgi:hypothetical protein
LHAARFRPRMVDGNPMETQGVMHRRSFSTEGTSALVTGDSLPPHTKAEYTSVRSSRRIG